MNSKNHISNLNIHGIKIQIISDHENLIKELEYDFKYFAAKSQIKADITIRAVLKKPDINKTLAKAKKTIKTKNWTLFSKAGNIRLVNYNNLALTHYNYIKEEGKIESDNPDILREIAYLLVLSRAGEKLDLKKLHRMHGFSVDIGGHGILFCAGRGAGKTTMLLELLKDDKIKLISDDTPLLSKSGDIFAFPLRIGLCENSPHLKNLKKENLKYFRRRNYSPKLLLDIDTFKNRIKTKSGARLFIIGKSRRRENALIKPSGFFASSFALLKYLAIGMGVPQISEYFLRLDLKDLISKANIARSRTLTCAALLKNCEFYSFYPGQDHARNAEKLKNFIEKAAEKSRKRI